MRVTIEPDDELNGAVNGAAAAAGSGDLGFPIGLLLVEAAGGFASLGDCRPGLVCAGSIGNKTAGWNGDLAHVRRFPFGHAETADLFSRGGKLRGHLGTGIGQRQPDKVEEEHSADLKKNTCSAHVADGITVASLAATDTTA
jgi:hypothetical protein